MTTTTLIITPWILLVAVIGFWFMSSVQAADVEVPRVVADVGEPVNLMAERVKGGTRIKWDFPEGDYAIDDGCVADWHRSAEFEYKQIEQHAWHWAGNMRLGVSDTVKKTKYKDSEWGEHFSPGNRYTFRGRFAVTRVGLAEPYYSDWVEFQGLYPSRGRYAPNIVAGLTDSRMDNGVMLQWEGTDDMSVVKFKVRRMNTQGARNEVNFTVSNMQSSTNSFMDETAVTGVDYGYFAAAVNNRGAGRESTGAYTDD